MTLEVAAATALGRSSTSDPVSLVTVWVVLEEEGRSARMSTCSRRPCRGGRSTRRLPKTFPAATFWLRSILGSCRQGASFCIDTEQRRPIPSGVNGSFRNPGLLILANSEQARSFFEGPVPGRSAWFSAIAMPPRFGAGLIDAIPDEVIEREAERQRWHTLTTQGTVARQKDGRIGRFGWKAQVPSLRDFVLNACAVELGLESPTHHQVVNPFGQGARPSAVDLSDEDCNALIDYVRTLPSPIEPNREQHEAGFDTFLKIGCSECHRPNLGAVEGLFSDLLLHEMGTELSDAGQYYGEESPSDTSPGNTKPGEWRTPPLWGIADSAPYLHDGRAKTLVDAIEAHAGQAEESRNSYLRLRLADRKNLMDFLRSLRSPRARSFAIVSRR